jgi:hypothetical protein
MKRTASLLAVVLAVAPVARSEDRFRVILNGVFNTSSPSFDETRSFTEYAEAGSLKVSYDTGGAFGFDGGAQVTLMGRLGVLVSYSSASRDETGTFQASLPHPLYLGRPRTVSGDLSGFKLREKVVHADLALGGKSGHLDYGLFAGVSFFTVEADVLDALHYTQSYPYDTVTLIPPAARSVKDSPVGFNAGARLDYRFGSAGRVGIGAQVRFSGATARLETASGVSAEVSAGGLAAGAGIRFYF